MNNNFYNQIVNQARTNCQITYGNKPIELRKRFMSKDPFTLRGYCAETSQQVQQILNKNNIKSKRITVQSGRSGGGNHIAVYVPSDNIIIDSTANQYGYNQYVFKLTNYPFKIKSM